MDLAFFGISKIEVFLLVLARTAGIFTLVPIFGANRVPGQIRVVMAAGLALVFVAFCAPAGTKPLATDIFTMLMMIARETLVGLVIGFVVILVFSAIQSAGDFVDMHSGFSFAATIDPVNGSQTAVAGKLNHMLAGLLFFITNIHHVVISGIADSFRVMPIGQLTFSPAVSGGVIELFVMLFAISIKLAAPVVAAVFVADLALAMMSRAVPQMNILMVGMPLKLGVGMVALIVALPVSMALTRSIMGDMHSQIIAMVRILGTP